MFLGADFEAPPVETRKALLLIDFQNDFTARDGKLPVKDAGAIVSRVAEVISGFRNFGEIVWATSEFQGARETICKDTGAYKVILPRFLISSPENEDEKDSDSSNPDVPVSSSNDLAIIHESDHEAFLADLPQNDDSRCCLPGSKGAEVTEQLASLRNPSRDIYVIKSDYSAFAAGSLMLSLRAKLVTELYLCGPLSHISVYATAVDAIRHGFTINILEDCVSHGNADCHDEALRQMRDVFGAELITGDELLEEVKEPLPVHHPTTEARSHYADHPLAAGSSDSLTLRPKVERWMSGLSDEEVVQAPPPEPRVRGSSTRRKISERLESKLSRLDRSDELSSHSSTSPPRKRSTGGLDARDSSPVAEHFLGRRRSAKVPRNTRLPQLESHPPRRRRTGRRRGEDSISSSSSRSTTGQSLPPASRIFPPPLETGISPNSKSSTVAPQLSHKERADSSRDQDDDRTEEYTFGEGDSWLLTDFLSGEDVDDLFERLKSEVQWQKMHHRSGEVPRLVAVQGQTLEDDSIPVYRHPADQSPPLLPWSPTVDIIKRRLEKRVGQPFNHALIQLYRSGEDNISEHSDKTLDIVRGSDIANISVGARRTMVLKTKKSYRQETMQNETQRQGSDRASSQDPSSHGARTTERIPLPHNSIFILGPATNRSWLHSIRADKRRPAEKAVEELAFSSQRISLTFRLVGTFINPTAGLIWGQGAKSKEPGSAGKISHDTREVERLIMAFGEENHQAVDFDWDKTYGEGFDVVNFVESTSSSQTLIGALHVEKALEAPDSSQRYKAPTILRTSTDPIANLRVKVFLAYSNIPHYHEPFLPGRSAPVIAIPAHGIEPARRLQGYEQIVSHFSPAMPTCLSDEAKENLMAWREYTYRQRFDDGRPGPLAGLTKSIHARRRPLPKPNECVSLADRDLWFVLHEVALREGGLHGLYDDTLKEFYRSVARTRIFNEALGGDLHRFIGE